jgi:hypothetical protein
MAGLRRVPCPERRGGVSTERPFGTPSGMADDATTEVENPTNTEKDPDDWVTGDEKMTGAQASYLETLSQEAGEEFDPSLTKADASKRIDELQDRTGRGR